MRLLDLYCAAGGASMGYHLAGFEVVGVDNEPQPKYPFEFHLADALDFSLDGFDAIHASPPCQAYSSASQQWRKAGKIYPDLIGPTRNLLKASRRPYIIENVLNAPLVNPIVLNGAFFGLKVRRVRAFECSFEMPSIILPKDAPAPFRTGRPVREGIDAITPVGHFSNVKYAQKEMGIDWMGQKELAQAIPPMYTKFIGDQLIRIITRLGRRGLHPL
jgi:DNA (cytosine-5)-methyltransferase 1